MLGMLGIHISAGTAEGWFGPGVRSVILSIATLSILPISIIAAVVLFTTNIGGETTIQQPSAPMAPVAPAPVVPTAPVPVVPTAPAPAAQTPSTTAKEPASTGVIEITAEKLASELSINWLKYKLGTVFQVSGVFQWQKEYFSAGSKVYFSLGPKVTGPDGTKKLGVRILVDMEKEFEVFKAFAALEGDREVVVQGTYYTFNNSYGQGAMLENASLISVK